RIELDPCLGWLSDLQERLAQIAMRVPEPRREADRLPVAGDRLLRSALSGEDDSEVVVGLLALRIDLRGALVERSRLVDAALHEPDVPEVDGGLAVGAEPQRSLVVSGRRVEIAALLEQKAEVVLARRT